VDLVGFSADELHELFQAEAEPGLTDPDDVPAPPDAPVTQPGDLWVLGQHRLFCGDSAKTEDVDRLLDGAAVHLVATDPPYNVRVEPRSNNAIAAGLSSFETTHHQQLDAKRHPAKAKPTTKKLRAKDRPLVNDFVSDKEFERLLHAWFGNLARVLQPGRSFYLWGGYANVVNSTQRIGVFLAPFLVLATQNPIEHEGTYPLPEAQVDRFMLKLKVTYPTREEERQILDRMTGSHVPEVRPVVTLDDIERARVAMHAIYVDDRIKDYAVRLVQATRKPKEFKLDLEGLVQYGASPRATMALIIAGRAHAFLRGRGFVSPEDIKAVGHDVMRHRLILSFEAEAEAVTADEVVQRVFDAVEVP
jgi:hypothetical protein